MSVNRYFLRAWINVSLCLGLGFSCSGIAQPTDPNVTVGSKRFTESYVLGEIINLSLRDAGVQSTHRQGLGNTAIVLKALTTGQIDIYPEYTGTIVREILKRPESAVRLLSSMPCWRPWDLKWRYRLALTTPTLWP